METNSKPDFSTLATSVSSTPQNSSSSDTYSSALATPSNPFSQPASGSVSWLELDSSDFNDDGNPDILWRNSFTGENIIWYMGGIDNTSIIGATQLITVGLGWNIESTADFNRDGNPDIFWRNSVNGENIIWHMGGVNNTSIIGVDSLINVTPGWDIKSITDFNKDGGLDVFWRNSINGENIIWHMGGSQNTNIIGASQLITVGSGWDIEGTSDFNRDGNLDIFWRNYNNGQNVIWHMGGSNNASIIGADQLITVGTNWDVESTSDFNRDGNLDIFWRNYTSGENIIWNMGGPNNTSIVGADQLLTVGTNWDPSANGSQSPDRPPSARRVNLSGLDFNILNEPLRAGEDLTIEFAIENTEAGLAGSFNVGFYLSTDETINTLDNLIDSYTVNGLLGNSNTGLLTQTLTLPNALDTFWNLDDTYYIGMVIDRNNAVVETNELDNSNQGFLIDYDDVFVNLDDDYEGNDTRLAAYDFSEDEQTWLSDLSGLGIQADDDWYEIDITPGFERLQVDLQFAHAVGDLDLEVYDASGNVVTSSLSTTDNEFIDIELNSAGTYYLRVFGYPGDTGNTYDLWWDDSFVPEAAINLSTSSFDVVEEPLSAGDSFTVQFAVQNTEAGNSGSFDVNFYLSSNDFISSFDQFLGSYTVNDLDGNGNTGTLSQIFTLPNAGDRFWNDDGLYYIGLIIDENDDVTETNEFDNRNRGELTDYDGVFINNTAQSINLLGNTFALNANSLNAGDSVSVDFAVLNEGTQDAGSFWVDFYLSSDTTIDADEDYLIDYQFISGLASNSSTGTRNQLLSLPDIEHPFWTGDGTYYIGMIVDALDGVSESNETDNAGVNLFVDYDDITVSNTLNAIDLRGVSFDAENNLAAGDLFDVSFSVENIGTLAADSFWVDFYLSTDANITDEDYLLGFERIDGLAGGSGTGLLSDSLFLPGANNSFWNGAGTYYVGMIVDALSDVEESDEGNNASTGEFIDYEAINIGDVQDQVDLAGLEFTVSSQTLSAGETAIATFEIQNLKSGSAGTFKAGFYLSPDAGITPSDYFLGEQTINSLSGNASTGDLTQTFTLPGAEDSFWQGDQTYFIGMILDSESAIGETDETNNASLGLSIDYDDVGISGTQTSIDLVGVQFDSAEPLSAGQDFDVNFQVENIGTSNAGNFRVGFYLSTDVTVSNTDLFLGSYSVNGLSAGGSTALVTETLTLPGASSSFWTGSGNYTIGMIIDYLGQVTETNEVNNANLGADTDRDIVDITLLSGTSILTGTLGADVFTVQDDVAQTIISGNGNVEFQYGQFDLLDLSDLSASSVILSYATDANGGTLYNPGNGARLFDAITLSNGSRILFEGIDRVRFSDQIIDLFESPNDPYFNDQWNLHMMGVHNAWRFTTGSTDVLVGVQDTGLGVNLSNEIHPDLGVTLFTDANNYADDYGSSNTSHGTAVQGIIAAASNNGIGVAGINWQSSVLNIDVIPGAGFEANDQSLAQATQNMINVANNAGQKLVINMSLSSGGSSAALDALVANNPDVLFVIAAGNGDIASLSYPAALAATYRNVIAVGASWGDTDAQGNSRNPGDRITYPGWWGSNYGTGLTIMGPSEVYTTQAFNSLGNVNFSYVDNFNGTSAATPNVAGVASLIWSANLDLTATDIREIITQTAFDLGAPGYDTEYGYGFINADAAVRRSLAIARGAA